MEMLNSDITDYLRKDAKIIRDVREKVKSAKEFYQPKIAKEIIAKDIEEIKKFREEHKKAVNKLIENEMTKIKEQYENKYISEGHQSAISNILKMLELRNFNVSEEQFENLISPLIKANDYITLDVLGDIMDSKEKYILGAYCKENVHKDKAEATEKVLKAFSEYINTNLLKSIGGDPLKYKNSSYEEIYILAKDLGFYVKDMERAFASDAIIVDEESFIRRQMEVSMGMPVEAPLFRFKDEDDSVEYI